jgi:ribosomal protein L17
MLGRNLVTSLFIYGRITTTLEKAKEFRGLAERLITWAKKGGLANYRRALSIITDKKVVKKLFNDLAKRFETRQGGYTRVIRFGDSRWAGKGHGIYAMNRLGDNSSRVIWELVERKDIEQEKYLAGRGPKAREELEKKRLEKRAIKQKK